MDQAVDCASAQAVLSGTAACVYRFKSWPAGVYGVRAADRLPPDAEKVRTLPPPSGVDMGRPLDKADQDLPPASQAFPGGLF